jgi:hypothetical protein
VSVVANVAINVDSRGAVSKLRQVQQGAQQTSGHLAALQPLCWQIGGCQHCCAKIEATEAFDDLQTAIKTAD